MHRDVRRPFRAVEYAGPTFRVAMNILWVNTSQRISLRKNRDRSRA